MDANFIMQAITTVGFPIVVCGVMFWAGYKLLGYMAKMDENHKDEVTKLSEAINNNSLVIQKLIDKLDKS